MGVASAIYKILMDITQPEERAERLGGKIKKLSDDSKIRVEADTKHAEASVSKLGGIFDKLKSTIGTGLKIGAITALGAGFTAGISDFLDGGAKFGAAQKELQALTGITGAAVDDLGQRARRSGIEFGTGATANLTVYKGVLSRLGPDIAKTPAILQEISDSVNTLSKATGDDATASMDAVTTSLLQFGDEANRFGTKGEAAKNFINVLAAGAKEGAAEVPQVAEAIRVAGVAASNAKVSFVETNAAIQALAQGGKVGAEAGTALRNVMGKLGEGRFLPKDVQAELKNAGVDITKLADTSLSFTDRLRELNKVQGDSALLSKLFGVENAAAGTILLKSIDYQDDLQKKITGTNSAYDQASIRQASFSETVEKLKAVGADVGISLFKIVEPVLTIFVKGATVVGQFFGTIVEQVGKSKPLMIALGIGVSAVVGLLAVAAVKNFFGSFVAGTLQTALGIVQRLVPSLITQTVATGGATTATLGLNAAMLATPLGLLAAGVALTAGAFILFGDKTKSAEDAIKDVNSAADEFDEANKKLGNVRATADNTRKLADEYDNLTGKENQTAEDKRRLEQITGQLNTATSGMATQWDAYGNVIGVATDKVRAMSDEQVKLAENVAKTTFNNFLAQSSAAFASLNKGVKEFKDLQTENKEGGSIFTKLEALVTRSADAISDARDKNTIAIGDISSKNGELVETIASGLARTTDRATVTYAYILRQARNNKEVADQVWVAYNNQLTSLDAQTAKQEEINRKAKESSSTAKKADEDLLAKAKQIAAEASKEYEIKLRLAQLQKGRKLTAEDELDIAEKAKKNLEDEINKLNLLSDEKYTVKANLAINESSIRPLDLKAKIVVDLEKARTDIESKINGLIKKEIELGIRPPEDLEISLGKQLKKVESELADVTLQLSFDDDGNIIGITDTTTAEVAKKYTELKDKVFSLSGDISKAEETRIKKIRDLRIENIADEEQRELAKLNSDNERDLQFVKDAIDAGRDLSNSELQLKEQLETKYQNKLRAIRKKSAEKSASDELTIAKTLHESLATIFAIFSEKKGKLGKEETEEKKLSYDGERNQIASLYEKGEIDARTYNAKLATLTKNRHDFEAQQEESFGSRIVAAKDAVLSLLLDKAGQYFLQLAGQYLLDALLFGTIEAEKTAAASLGAALRVAASIPETAAKLLGAAASGIAAAAEAAYTAIVGLPFPLNIVAAGGAIASVYGLYQGAKSTFGFERGGVVVGERGPEFIQPFRDASYMASSITRGLIATVRQELRADGYRRGGGAGTMNVNLKGRLTEKGRDLAYALEVDEMVTESESLVSKSLRQGSFQN